MRCSCCSLLLAVYGLPGGFGALLPLAGLVAWLALSISWSTLPDRSWDYADRGLVYLLFAALGLWLASAHACARERALRPARRGRRLVARGEGAAGRARLRAAGGRAAERAGRALEPARAARRVRAAARALAAASRRDAPRLCLGRRAAAHVLARRDPDGASSSSSRGSCSRTSGSRARRRSSPPRCPPRVVVAIAFALPGVTSDGQSSHVRWRDGLIFGALLLAGAVAAAALERLPRPRVVPALRRGPLVAVALLAGAAVLFVVLKGAGSGAVGNGGGRLGSTSSNFRFVWWRQAWDGFRGHELAGTGAGTFHLANLRFRDELSRLHDRAAQPAVAVPRRGGGRRARAAPARRRRVAARQPAALAGTSSPSRSSCRRISCTRSSTSTGTSSPSRPWSFLVAGSLVGKPPLRRVSPFASLAAAGAARARVRRAAPARGSATAGRRRRRSRSTRGARSRSRSGRAPSIRCSSSRC